MFSPYYAWARRRAPSDPLRHCALNVVLYGRGGKRWAMTERPAAAIVREASGFRLGPSALRWEDDGLTIDIDEVTCPLPSRLRGRVRVHPRTLYDRTFTLDAHGRHRWRPIAPRARVEVALSHPARAWSGPCYLDTNEGDAPLEQDFERWNWSRAPVQRGTGVLYDVLRSDGSRQCLALCYTPSGGIEERQAPPLVPLPKGPVWRVGRETRVEDGAQARVRRTLEDTPFYTRSVLDTCFMGEPATAMHESLSLSRFKAPWVQALLPFRVPRALR